MILGIKTDQPVAELYIFNAEQEFEYSWKADRQLARDLLAKIEEFIHIYNYDWADVSGLIVYSGPGSFTGLRIGCTVANTISYSLGVPVVAAQTESWKLIGDKRLKSGENDKTVLPDYGSEPHITQQKR